jgi:hypothetical protein
VIVVLLFGLRYRSCKRSYHFSFVDGSEIVINGSACCCCNCCFVSLLLILQKYKVDPEHVHCVFLAASPVGTLMPLTDEQIEAPAEFGTVSTYTSSQFDCPRS